MKEFTYFGNDGCPLYAVSIEPEVNSSESALIFLHGGGTDHNSLIPLARELQGKHKIILPDIRGYGRSVCRDEGCHTWTQYSNDIISLINHMGASRVILGGAGIGTTISLRTALTFPEKIQALILISIEDIEDDEAKKEEIKFMEAFAARVRSHGIEAAWEPILKNLSPVIRYMVSDAIPRSDPASIAASAAIGFDRAFHSIADLEGISVPTLIIPGADERHPAALAGNIAKILPKGQLATVSLSSDIKTSDEFSQVFAPTIKNFLESLGSEGSLINLKNENNS